MVRFYLVIVAILLSGCGDTPQAIAYRYAVLAELGGVTRKPPDKHRMPLSSKNKYFDENCKRNECPEIDMSLMPATGVADGQQFFQGTVNEFINWTMRFKSPIKKDRVKFAVKENPNWMSSSLLFTSGDLRFFGRPDTITENGTVKILVRDFSRCFALENQNFKQCDDLSREFPIYDKTFSMQFKIKASPN
jgi:hypothetical protein